MKLKSDFDSLFLHCFECNINFKDRAARRDDSCGVMYPDDPGV